nr:sensor domain-containing diguanylate cyclase [Rugamonas sp.]
MLAASAFVILVCASLVGVEAWLTWRARVVQLSEARIASNNVAEAVAQHAYDTIKEADTVLVGLVERVEHDGAGTPAELERLHQLLALRVRALPQLHGLFVYGADGAWITNSEPSMLSGQNNADREYFIYHRSHTGDAPHIGPPIRSKSTHEWIVTVSRRINRADGGFGGVALATIKMAYFKKFQERYNIGQAGAIFLATDQGTLLIRRPYDEAMLGRDISALPLFARYLSVSSAGTATIKSRLDGVTRINSYRRLEEYPLVVSAALSEAETLADWRTDAWRNGIMVAVIVLGIGALGFRLILQIQQRVEAENELRKARGSLETLNATLEQLAMQDGLTGLANRRKFDTAITEEFSRATRNASALALIMIDVDCFKQYNDIYGHAAGDACLRAIGRVVGDSKRRPGDMAARYGGEELAVLLPGTDVAGALVVAEKIRQAIYALELVHSGNPNGVVTVSAGVEAFEPVGGEQRPVDLIEAADKLLYQAKRSGRNRVGARAAVAA